MTKLKEKFFVTESLSTFCQVICAIFALLLYLSIAFVLLLYFQPDYNIIQIPEFLSRLWEPVMMGIFTVLIPCAQLCALCYLPVFIIGAVLVWATINAQNEKNAFAIINPTVLGTCALVAGSSAVLVTVITNCF